MNPHAIFSKLRSWFVGLDSETKFIVIAIPVIIAVFTLTPIAFEAAERPTDRLYETGKVEYVERSIYGDGSVYGYVIKTSDVIVATYDKREPKWKGDKVYVYDGTLFDTFICTEDMRCREIANISRGNEIAF